MTSAKAPEYLPLSGYSWSSVSPLLVLSRLALRALRPHLFHCALCFQLVVCVGFYEKELSQLNVQILPGRLWSAFEFESIAIGSVFCFYMVMKQVVGRVKQPIIERIT